MLNCCRKFSNKPCKTSLGLSLVMLVAVLLSFPTSNAMAAALHGIGVAKSCTNPKLVGQKTDCSITALNNTDTFGDSLTVTGMFDIVKGTVREPPVSGNLPIVAVSGTTTCVVAGSFPCTLGVGATVTVRSNQYVILATDTSPLPDQGQIAWNDQCNGTPDAGCTTAPQTATAGGNTIIVQCIVAADCPGSDGVCGARTCVANVCGVSFSPSTTICRASAGVCDVAESCTGSNVNCPTDVFQPSTTICRASAGVCDVAESCTGTSAACPTDVFQPSTTICRASAGVCDVAESCTGTGASCPADAFLPATTPCNAALCESCSGTGAACSTVDLCIAAACRTVGYWGTHAGTEKDGSVNITQATINTNGGSILVCGKLLKNTLLNSKASAEEAICASGGGETQLGRQLVALALNCVNSKTGGYGNPPCTGVTPFVTIFNTCSAICANPASTDAQINNCESQVDCLNNGGTPALDGSGNFVACVFKGTCSDNKAACTNIDLSKCLNPATATCNPSPTCENNPLLFPDSPAGSSDECNDARKTDCEPITDIAACTLP
jgi:hypothetical protein